MGRYLFILSLLFATPASAFDCKLLVYRVRATEDPKAEVVKVTTDFDWNAGWVDQSLKYYRGMMNPSLEVGAPMDFVTNWSFLSLNHTSTPDALWKSSYGRKADALMKIYEKAKKAGLFEGTITPKDATKIRNAFRRLGSQFFKLPPDVFSEPTLEDGVEAFEIFTVKLPWNAVRIEYETKEGVRGYFIASAWNPVRNELIFAVPDFVPNSAAITLQKDLPSGRGIPLDARAEQANCGPCALAAYLNRSTKEVIGLLEGYREKGYAGIRPLAAAAAAITKRSYVNKLLKQKTKSLAEAVAPAKSGIVLIRWRATEEKETYGIDWGHWVAYDTGLVYDMNVSQEDGTMGAWIPENRWASELLPKIAPRGATTFYVRNVVIPKE